MKKKTAIQRLSWKLAESVAELIDDRHILGDAFSPSTYLKSKAIPIEDIYHVIWRTMPLDVEDIAAEQEAFDAMLYGPPIDRGPSMLKRLRDAVCADEGAPLGVVINAAIDACIERDLLLRKEQHGCGGVRCGDCDESLK